MYQFLDRKLDELDAPAAFLVGAMRLWVTCVQAGRCPCAVTARHFDGAGLANVADDFGMAMFTLNGDALEPLHFAPHGCHRVSDDEARLLALFLSPGEGHSPLLDQLAATLVHPGATARLTMAVSIVAAHLAATQISTRFD
jgi:hypothetical protein